MTSAQNECTSAPYSCQSWVFLHNKRPGTSILRTWSGYLTFSPAHPTFLLEEPSSLCMEIRLYHHRQRGASSIRFLHQLQKRHLIPHIGASGGGTRVLPYMIPFKKSNHGYPLSLWRFKYGTQLSLWLAPSNPALSATPFKPIAGRDFSLLGRPSPQHLEVSWLPFRCVPEAAFYQGYLKPIRNISQDIGVVNTNYVGIYFTKVVIFFTMLTTAM